MAQQTPIEWLVNQLKEYDFADITDQENYIIKIQSWVLTEKIEQAKQIDKKHKKLMFDCGRQYQLTGEGTFEQIYRELYEPEAFIYTQDELNKFKEWDVTLEDGLDNE
jgi:hypothetical protein